MHMFSFRLWMWLFIVWMLTTWSQKDYRKLFQLFLGEYQDFPFFTWVLIYLFILIRLAFVVLFLCLWFIVWRFPMVSYCTSSRRICVGSKNGTMAFYELKQSKAQVIPSETWVAKAVSFYLVYYDCWWLILVKLSDLIHCASIILVVFSVIFVRQ